jgi:hypothetical protein
MPTPKYLEDKTKFIGKKFNRWTVIDVVDKSRVLAQCECGSPPKPILLTLLRRGKSKGCYACRGTAISEKMRKHGQSNTRLYNIWRAMYHRCKNPTQDSYKRLHIDMCEEWENSFESFRNWSIESGYNDSLEIDRIDNSLGYSPVNCRWVDRKRNQNNKSNNVRTIYNGVERSVEEISEMSGINKDLIYRRLKKGLKDQELTAPPKYNGKNKNDAVCVNINGVDVSLSEIAKQIGVNITTIKRRYNKTKNVQDIFAPTTWNKYTEKEKALINEKLAKAKEYYLGGE